MVYLFLANGFETIEALAVVDMLRRAKIDVKTVGVTGKIVISSHNIDVTADIEIDEFDVKDADAVVLPGGMPGTLNLEADKTVQGAIDYCVENKKYISTGLGFGAERGCGLLYEMMEMYQTIPFILEDGSENKKTCPVINTEIFLKHGLEQKDKQQILEGNIMILPSICMCPIDFETGYRRKSKKTISVHWFHASWMERAEREYHKKHRQALLEEKKNDWKYLPNRMIKKLLGEKISELFNKF